MNKNLARKLGVCFVVFLLIGGITFRVENLGQKVYWSDEVFTSLQISGHSQQEISENLLTGREIGLEDIKQYQYPMDAGKTYYDTIKNLISIESQHTPLYFLTSRFWLKVFGSSVFVIRSVSLIASIISLFLMYWLCSELFVEKPLVGWLASALMAISPFHLYYAQEARPFSLWIMLTLFSCLMLLRAQKMNSLKSWAIYSFSIPLSLYTFLFSGLTCIAHFTYILAHEKIKLSQTVLRYSAASFLGVLAFFPWILVMITHPPSNYASQTRASLLYYLQAWLRNIGFLFIDFNVTPDSPKFQIGLYGVYILFLVSIVAYSFWFLLKSSEKKSRLFIINLFLVPSLILLAYDFSIGGQMTARPSYLVPILISIEIMVAYTISEKLIRIQGKRSVSIVVNFIVTLIISVSFLSCFKMSQAVSWWPKQWDQSNPKVAEIINRSERPLVISEDGVRAISLSYQLKPSTKYQFLVNPEDNPKYKNLWHIPEISSDHTDVFLYNPSEALLTGLSDHYYLTKYFEKYEETSIESVGTALWKVDKKM